MGGRRRTFSTEGLVLGAAASPECPVRVAIITVSGAAFEELGPTVCRAP